MSSELAQTIGALERGLRTLLDKQISQEMLDFSQWTILVRLAKEDWLEVTRLMEFHTQEYIADPAETRLALDSLVERKMVQFSQVRPGHISLTEEGQSILNRVKVHIAKHMEELMEGLDPDHLRLVTEVLRMLRRRLSLTLSSA